MRGYSARGGPTGGFPRLLGGALLALAGALLALLGSAQARPGAEPWVRANPSSFQTGKAGYFSFEAAYTSTMYVDLNAWNGPADNLVVPLFHTESVAIAASASGIEARIPWTPPAGAKGGTFCVYPKGGINSCAAWQVTGGTATTPASPHEKGQPPRVSVRRTSGVVPGIVRLPFAVTDDSGRATVYVTVKANGKKYAGGPGTRSARGEWQSTGISLPEEAAGPASFCVYAADAAGNKSNAACAALTLTRRADAAEPATADTKAPIVKTKAYIGPKFLDSSESYRRSAIKLRYFVNENSGRATIAIVVFIGKQAIWRTAALRNVAAKGRWYARQWQDPTGGDVACSTKWSCRFCVQATDPAGNRSRTTCSMIWLTS